MINRFWPSYFLPKATAKSFQEIRLIEWLISHETNQYSWDDDWFFPSIFSWTHGRLIAKLSMIEEENYLFFRRTHFSDFVRSTSPSSLKSQQSPTSIQMSRSRSCVYTMVKSIRWALSLKGCLFFIAKLDFNVGFDHWCVKSVEFHLWLLILTQTAEAVFE